MNIKAYCENIRKLFSKKQIIQAEKNIALTGIEILFDIIAYLFLLALSIDWISGSALLFRRVRIYNRMHHNIITKLMYSSMVVAFFTFIIVFYRITDDDI
jgi:hypothetical protein